MKRFIKNPLYLAILIAVIIVTIVIVLLAIFLPKGNSRNNDSTSIIIYEEPKEGLVRFDNYMNYLGDNYTVKFIGNFKDNNGEVKNAIVDFSKKDTGFAVKSNDLDLHIVTNKEEASIVSNRYKMIAKVPVLSLDILSYNLVDKIGQEFVKSYNETFETKDYYVEEYTLDSEVIKYYFLNSDLKVVYFMNEYYKILRVQKESEKQLFELPSGYSEM